MTNEQLIQGFIRWAQAHGIVALPENDEQWTPVPLPDVKVPTLMTYIAPNGARLRLPVDVMVLEADKDSTMAIYLGQVLSLYGRPPKVEIAWSEFLNPKPAVPAAPNAVLGAEVPRETVSMQATLGGRIDPAKRYWFAAGTTPDGCIVVVDGKRYLAVKPSPFALWLQLLG